MKHTSEEIKYRLSDLGVQIGNIAIEYITELEKENAELKEKLNKIERKCKFNFVDLLHDVENESKQEDQLTNAKEIIKKLLSRLNRLTYTGLNCEECKEAEQFLKEVEK